MKMNGTVLGPREEVIVLPRPQGDIVFTVRAVLDFSDFEKLCPEPQPPWIQRPNQPQALNVEDRDYKKSLAKFGMQKLNWMILESLKPTPSLTWEKVDSGNPETWHLWRQEMSEAGFPPAELNHIGNVVFEINGLNPAKLDEAKRSFLAGMGEKK